MILGNAPGLRPEDVTIKIQGEDLVLRGRIHIREFPATPVGLHK
jgi:HSP20 family molecular chaperone IbpA